MGMDDFWGKKEQQNGTGEHSEKQVMRANEEKVRRKGRPRTICQHLVISNLRNKKANNWMEIVKYKQLWRKIMK